MMSNYDLVVIGAGPAGEVGAIRAAQLGLKTAIIEKNEHLGGTCLNVGCIPTKSLLHSAKTWKNLQKAASHGFSYENLKFDWQKILAEKQNVVDAQRKGLRFLMKKNKIDVFTGTASFHDPQTLTVKLQSAEEQRISAKSVLIATGSKVREFPQKMCPKIDGKNIHSSDTILFIQDIPKRLAVIGGGVVGLEFASLFARFGSDVTVYEVGSQVIPHEDAECAQELVRQLKKQSIKIEVSTKLTSIKDHGDHLVLELEEKDSVKFDKVLISIGRSPVTDGLALEKAKLKADDQGFIPVDAHYRTAGGNIFAVGDVIKTPALAHTASAEAMHAVEVIAGHTPPLIDYLANPSAIYTDTEVASIGHTEAKLKDLGIPYKVAKFPFAPLAKAKIEDATEGFIKILFGNAHREILGVHIVGAKATELISEFVLGKILETTLDEIGQAIHPHPTLSETIMEAAHAGLGGAIHL